MFNREQILTGKKQKEVNTTQEMVNQKKIKFIDEQISNTRAIQQKKMQLLDLKIELYKEKIAKIQNESL